jgi:hypothetical protein
MPSEAPTEESKNKPRRQNGGTRSTHQRDKPAFTSMRRPQFQQEFSTDSLNNSYIASPSPVRPAASSSTRNKPRPTRGGLSAAFQRLDNKRDERNNKQRAGSTRGNASHRPSPSRRHTQDSPIPSPKVIPDRNTRTPSPQRGRSVEQVLSPISIVSDASASSPPRGLTEAYQQIADEADLAAQEESGEEDTEDIIFEDQENSNLLQPEGRTSSRKSSRKRSPVPQAVRLDPGDKSVDTTENLTSIPSEIASDPGMEESPTPSRRQKDLQRIRNVLENSQPFGKAKPKSKFTLEGLKREEASSPSGSSRDSNGTGSVFSDGALNIPPTWGRKARQGRVFMTGFDRQRMKEENPLDKTTKDKEKLKAIEDWQAEASMTPLPQAGGDSLLDTPEEIKHKPSLEQLKFWESKDTPPALTEPAKIRVRNPAIDIIRQREIQNLTRSALTTNRLGELKEKRSLERVVRRVSSIGSESGPMNEKMEATQSKSNSSSSSVVQDEGDIILREPLLETSNGTPIPNSPVVVYNTRRDDSIKKSDEAQPGRTDTRDLLRQLAKVSSPSPEPIAKSDQKESLEKTSDQISVDTQPSPTELDKSVAQDSGAESKPPQLETPSQSKPKIYLKTPLVTGAWIETPLPTVKSMKSEVDTIKVEESKELVQETLKKVKLEDLAQESKVVVEKKSTAKPLEDTAPKLPASALAAILDDAKAKNEKGFTKETDDTLQLGESTINDLEELLANSDGEAQGPKKALESKNEHAVPESDQKKDRSKRGGPLEAEDYELLASRLNHLKLSIHDTRNDLGSLEKHLDKRTRFPDSDPVSRSRSRSRARSECEEAGEFHDFIWPCEKCGHAKGNGAWDNDSGNLLDWHWRPLQVYMPQLWFWPSEKKLPRLTKLGWWTFLGLLLVIIELILW